MTSESEAVMTLQHEWILENVGEEPMKIASKMILFRGEKVFRVGLKNNAKDPILFFLAIDLRKMGMKVRDVKYGMQSIVGPAMITPMCEDCIYNGGSLQLFAHQTDKKIVGNCTFVFQIFIEGTDHGYSYQLSDRLAKDQLWAALITQQWTDVEFYVKDKMFPAHQSILAAHSQVFAAEFEKKQPVKDGPHQFRIDGVEPSTVENFLHFIYTGQPKGTLKDKDLLKLADHYQLTTLTSLCKVALKEIDAMHIANIMKFLNSDDHETSCSRVTSEKETEIFFDRTTFTFCCSWTLDEKEESTCVIQYQNQDIVIAYLTGEKFYEKKGCKRRYVEDPVVHLSFAKHRNFGFKVEDIYCELGEDNEWLKMESKYCQKNAELLHIAVKSPSRFYADYEITANFVIKTVCTIGNYYYELMDENWWKDSWAAATNQKLTDVEIFIGTVKLMEAHRVILCARSPVLNETLNKISNTEKSVVTFGAEFEVEIVKNFLNFLYTGFLNTTEGGHQLGRLATMYQVETLKNVCQLLNANPPDAENLTDYLIQL